MVTNTQGVPATALIEATSSAAMSLYRRIVDPMAAVELMGKSIAGSGMLGEISVDAGKLLALECLSSGIPPLSLKRRYHVTKFGLMQQASWTMSEFQRAGGKVKELSRTPDLAKAELSLGDDKYTVELSWKAAQDEPFVYKGKEDAIVEWLRDPKKKKELNLKAKYATPLSRAQMLWWRVIGDGIRAHWPEINGGIYSPEEVGEEPPTDGEIEGEFQVHSPAAQTSTAQTVEATAEVVHGGGAVESHNAALGTPQPSTAATSVDSSPTDQSCTAEQSAAIRDLFIQVGYTGDQQEQILQRLKASAIRNLPADQAEKLIANLNKKLAEKQLAASAETTSTKLEAPTHDKPVMTARTKGPCTADQAAAIKKLVVELNQSKPGTAAAFKAGMEKAGCPRIADLSMHDAERLIGALTIKQMDQFFAESFGPYQADPPATDASAEAATEAKIEATTEATDPAKN